MIGDKIKKILLIFMGVVVIFAGILILVSTISSKKKSDDSEVLVDKIEVEDFVKASENDAKKKTEATTEMTTEMTTEAEVATRLDATKTERASSGDFVPKEVTLEDDKEAPVFLISASNINVVRGTNFNIHDHIGYGDDVDREVELVMDGNVDTSTNGDYPITLTLKDDAGHTKTASVKVSVIDSAPSDSGGSSRHDTESFSEFKEKYGNGNVSFGLDVSRWQKDIDFNKVKAAGCDFVIMRIGGYDDGENYTDAKYDYNIRAAKEAGLKVGIYWHAEESSPEEVKGNIDYLLNVLDGEKLDFPIAYDWEDFLKFEEHGMNINDLNNCYETFASELEAKGYETCIYSSKNFLQTVWKNEYDHKIWLAHYTSQTDYTGDYYMWQHTSVGRIDGISTDVDFNILYLDRFNGAEE